jgi:hypothetical protein
MSLDRLKRKRAVIEDLAREVCAALSGTSIGWSAAQRALASYLAFDIDEELAQDPAHRQEQETKGLQAHIYRLEAQLKNLENQNLTILVNAGLNPHETARRIPAITSVDQIPKFVPPEVLK